MQNHQVTIKDIAKELGISPSTVSRALKDHPDISTKTKDKVKGLAKKLKYRPNEIALSLKHRKTKVIGIIVPEMVHHFFSSIISGISEVAYANGYNVMITQSSESYEREVKDVQSLISSRVVGVLASVAKTTTNFDHYQSLLNNGIPVVFFDRVSPNIAADRIVVDDFSGAYKAVIHMLKAGRKKILHLAAPQHLLIGQNRVAGYKKALAEFGIPINENLIVKCDTYEDGVQETKKLLEKGIIPDGIFAVNDATAIGAMKAVKKAGYKIPDDVSVVGFTNGLISKMTDPTLTTIEQQGFLMGTVAAETLLKRISGEMDNMEPITKSLKTELVVREST